MKIELFDDGNDVLRIVATEADTETKYTAFGWVSAVENHYDEEVYQPVVVGIDDAGNEVVDNHRTDDAVPRKMTNEEVIAYTKSLLEAANPGLFEQKIPQGQPEQAPPAPKPLYEFEAGSN